MKSKKRQSIRRAIIFTFFLFFPIIIIIITAIMAGGFKKIDFFYQTINGISINTESIIGSFVIYFTIIFLIFVLASTAGKRGFCHYVCWMAPFMVIGTKISNLLRLPALRPKSDKEKCINCKLCSKNCPLLITSNSLHFDLMIPFQEIKNTFLLIIPKNCQT